MSKRDRTLDLAKGYLIILVVLGHNIQYLFGSKWLMSSQFFDDVVFKAIYSFHMPLFMMISGYLFYNSNKREFMPLIVSKLKAIGIPLLSFILLCNVSQYWLLLIHGDVSELLLHYTSAIFLGKTMWFLLSILLNMVVVAVLTRLIKGKLMQCLGMLILFIVSLFFPDTVLLSVHKFMFPFFCIGYLLNQNKVPLYTSNKKLLFIISVLSLLAIYWFNRYTYIYISGFSVLGRFPGQLLTDGQRMVIALIVSYTFMQYCRIVSRYNNLLINSTIKLGQMSLFIYGADIVFNVYYSEVSAMLSVNFEFTYIVPLIGTAVFIIICYYLYRLFEKVRLTRLLFLGKQ